MRKWTGAFQVAAVYIGTVIGAGFATGKEIVEFFTQYSLYGFFGILFTGYLFIMMGTKMMVKAIEIDAHSYKEFNEYLFGVKFARVMNVFMTIMLIGVCAVMLSGAEALFEEQLGLGKLTGSVVTITLSIVVLIMGAKGLFAVNTFVVPLLIFFNILVMITALTNGESLSSFLAFPDKGEGWRAGGSALSYAAFNITLAQAVLVPIASEIKDTQIIRRGGWLGGFFLTIILISSHITITTLPNFLNYEIPMAVIVNNTTQGIYIIYLFIIYGEIFTSLIGNLYGIERQLKQHLQVRSIWIFLSVMTIVYLIGRVNYSTLLGILYPLFGYVSLLFLILLWRKPMLKN